MSRRVVRTDAAPQPYQGSPYSQAIVAGGFAFASGQVGGAADGSGLVPGGIAEQTDQALANLAAVLEAAGASLASVVKTTVFLQNLDDFTEMNDAYARHFPEEPPARSTVEVAKLPAGALVEIEAIALVR